MRNRPPLRGPREPQTELSQVGGSARVGANIARLGTGNRARLGVEDLKEPGLRDSAEVAFRHRVEMDVRKSWRYDERAGTVAVPKDL